MRDILIGWLHKGLLLGTGEELYIQADGKDHQKTLYKQFRDELEVMRKLDPEGAAKLRIGTTFKDLKFWVFIKKINITPLVGFKKGDSGVEKITLDIPKRRIV